MEKKVYKTPILELVMLSESGLLTFYVDQPVNVPRWPQIDGLTEQQTIEAFDIGRFMKMRVLSDQFTDADQEISIKRFYIVKFTSQFVKIQVEFLQPNSITLDSSSPDELVITITDSSLFTAEIGGLPVEEGTEFVKELVPQLFEEQLEAIKELEASMNISMMATSWGNFVVQLLVS